jgi:hypothetical protein
MRNELTGTTAISDGVVGIPGAKPNDKATTNLNSAGGALPPNKPNSNPTTVAPIGATALAPDSTGPPESNDYWHGLIDEKTAADFMDLTPRWLQAKRQHGDGPKFIRISQRCVKYTRYWLKTYADDRLRSSTADQGEATGP